MSCRTFDGKAFATAVAQLPTSPLRQTFAEFLLFGTGEAVAEETGASSSRGCPADRSCRDLPPFCDASLLFQAQKNFERFRSDLSAGRVATAVDLLLGGPSSPMTFRMARSLSSFVKNDDENDNNDDEDVDDFAVFMSHGSVPLVEVAIAGPRRDTVMQLAIQHGVSFIAESILNAYASFMSTEVKDDSNSPSSKRRRRIIKFLTRAVFLDYQSTPIFHIGLQHCQLTLSRLVLHFIYRQVLDVRRTPEAARHSLLKVLGGRSRCSSMSIWHLAFKFGEESTLLSDLLQAIHNAEDDIRATLDVHRLPVILSSKEDARGETNDSCLLFMGSKWFGRGERGGGGGREGAEVDGIVARVAERLLQQCEASSEGIDVLRARMLEELTAPDLRGLSPLHYLAASERRSCSSSSSCDEIIKLIQRLAKNGLLVLRMLRTAPTGFGTLLHTAAFHNNVSLVVSLCGKDGSGIMAAASEDDGRRGFVDATNDDLGATALWIAASKGHVEIIRALSSAGANSNACNRLGVSALCAAVQCGHKRAARLLVDLGAEVTEEILQLAVRGNAKTATSNMFQMPTGSPGASVLPREQGYDEDFGVDRRRLADDEDNDDDDSGHWPNGRRSVSPSIAAILQGHVPVVSDQGGLDWYMLVVLWVLVSYAVARLFS